MRVRKTSLTTHIMSVLAVNIIQMSRRKSGISEIYFEQNRMTGTRMALKRCQHFSNCLVDHMYSSRKRFQYFLSQWSSWGRWSILRLPVQVPSF